LQPQNKDHGQAKSEQSPSLSFANFAVLSLSLPGIVAYHGPCHHLWNLDLLLYLCSHRLVATALPYDESPKLGHGITDDKNHPPTYFMDLLRLIHLPTPHAVDTHS